MFNCDRLAKTGKVWTWLTGAWTIMTLDEIGLDNMTLDKVGLDDNDIGQNGLGRL